MITRSHDATKPRSHDDKVPTAPLLLAYVFSCLISIHSFAISCVSIIQFDTKSSTHSIDDEIHDRWATRWTGNTIDGRHDGDTIKNVVERNTRLQVGLVWICEASEQSTLEGSGGSVCYSFPITTHASAPGFDGGRGYSCVFLFAFGCTECLAGGGRSRRVARN